MRSLSTLYWVGRNASRHKVILKKETSNLCFFSRNVRQKSDEQRYWVGRDLEANDNYLWCLEIARELANKQFFCGIIIIVSLLKWHTPWIFRPVHRGRHHEVVFISWSSVSAKACKTTSCITHESWTRWRMIEACMSGIDKTNHCLYMINTAIFFLLFGILTDVSNKTTPNGLSLYSQILFSC